ncbi:MULTISPECIES: peroxiredoxin-like family protein [Cellulophaga]|uniref:Alkyl hydroperoxide reductase/ Thiol specific antioxidant/ Mal allergen n=1 Tax=Cellulophaga lytica (strain ATCC 23178 / DSM 7489 / JCM 8516 / NBRC 14961 / NCIMB 1423 / VKM B-1433 / Cy l20) TaxID=867900 RepID=F0RBK3_CELLC|nr:MULTISPECIES: peroxiredoxin-like family protein [Cellulophaga]ADY30653.1 alkyl hydroperoxide reductase/ Thiol specific antioxidant/ Mal allergen [Cellulophaga lytica DSM 7489]AIM61637.1 alkyl hydroperoxide reductase [Cellulophaga lytica]TVZ10034.1 peroxiredoxin [Cellulophaga sp. RHA_52]WQG78420.1 peroxiredoxin-like family protein [Cellulophaga lytica]SNQ44675.1 Peroxiredoxin [Cellulophaga lytica]
MIKPREKAPELSIKLVNDSTWKLSEQSPENFTLILFYRGKHCPVCQKQLEQMQKSLPKFTERGVNVIAISSDTEEVAKETYKDWDIDDIPLGYGLSIDEARKWGLFISSGIKKEPDYFTEPGLFLLSPDSTVYWESIQSMPFGRPEFRDVLGGIDYILKANYPARGEA